MARAASPPSASIAECSSGLTHRRPAQTSWIPTLANSAPGVIPTRVRLSKTGLAFIIQPLRKGLRSVTKGNGTARAEERSSGRGIGEVSDLKSEAGLRGGEAQPQVRAGERERRGRDRHPDPPLPAPVDAQTPPLGGGCASTGAGMGDSEEHTSEIQSRPHLVCRLLLAKKKQSLF